MSETEPRRSLYGAGTTANMLRSLAVIVGLMVLLMFVVARVDQVRQPPVDAGAVATYQAGEQNLPFVTPVGLPAGWRATSAGFAPSTDGVKMLSAVWLTPDDTAIAVRQAAAVTPNWLKESTANAVPAGRVTIDGGIWDTLTGDNGQTSYLQQDPSGMTRLITGRASAADFTTLISALRPAR